MGILIGLFAIVLGQTANNVQTANPQRFTASDIRVQGNTTSFHGSVLMKTPSATIVAEDADFNTREYMIYVHGDSRWELLPVRSQPDFNGDPTDIRPISDPARLSASEIKKTGDVTHLRGNVVMQMPGIIIYAEDADFNEVTATVTIHGD